MDAKPNQTPAPRRRRRHSPEYKARLVAACAQPGITIAAVALANNLNANLLRRWIKEQPATTPQTPHDHRIGASETPRLHLLPVTIDAPKEQTETPPAIQIEIHRPKATLASLTIRWPTTQAATCAQFLQELLR